MQPRRLAVRNDPPAILLEYGIEGSDAIRRKIFNVKNWGSTYDTGVVAQKLIEAYPAYLSKVQHEQLTRLVRTIHLKSRGADMGKKIQDLAQLEKSGIHDNVIHANNQTTGLDWRRPSIIVRSPRPLSSSQSVADAMNMDVDAVDPEGFVTSMLCGMEEGGATKPTSLDVGDLNKVSEQELLDAKRRMNTTFEANALLPGEPGFVHDRRQEFGTPKEDCGWDDDE